MDKPCRWSVIRYSSLRNKVFDVWFNRVLQVMMGIQSSPEFWGTWLTMVVTSWVHSGVREVTKLWTFNIINIADMDMTEVWNKFQRLDRITNFSRVIGGIIFQRILRVWLAVFRQAYSWGCDAWPSRRKKCVRIVCFSRQIVEGFVGTESGFEVSISMPALKGRRTSAGPSDRSSRQTIRGIMLNRRNSRSGGGNSGKGNSDRIGNWRTLNRLCPDTHRVPRVMVWIQFVEFYMCPRGKPFAVQIYMSSLIASGNGILIGKRKVTGGKEKVGEKVERILLSDRRSLLIERKRASMEPRNGNEISIVHYSPIWTTFG